MQKRNWNKYDTIGLIIILILGFIFEYPSILTPLINGTLLASIMAYKVIIKPLILFIGIVMFLSTFKSVISEAVANGIRKAKN